jgi:hypothetical protein
LQPLLHFDTDAGPAVGNDSVHLAAADHMAQRALGRVVEAALGVANVDQIVDRIVDHVLHRELHVDDVLVLGQHQSLVGVAVDPGNVDLLDPVNDGRVPVQAGQHDIFLGLAEAEHHAALLFVDRVQAKHAVSDTRKQQQAPQGARGDPATAAGIAAATTAKDSGQLVLQLAERLVQIGRALIAPVAPGIFVVAAWLIPSHSYAPLWRGRCTCSALIPRRP